MKTNAPIPVKEAMKDNPEVAKMVEDLKAGRISPCSPFPGMHTPWTQNEKESFGRALDEILSKNKKTEPS